MSPSKELSVITNEVLEGAVQEIEAIVVEKAYEFQNAKLELFWLTGETLRRYEREQKVNITALVAACAADNRLAGKQMGERNLFWAVRIFDEYPDKNFPDGKGASLTKVKKLLTAGGAVAPEEVTPENVAKRIVDKYGREFAHAVGKALLAWPEAE